MAKEELKLTAKEIKLMGEISQKNEYELMEAGHATLYTQYKGVWDMEGLLKAIIEFYTKEKFKFFEKQQRHRHPGPFGVERLYRIEAYRDLDEFCRWESSIVIETFDEHDVDVMEKGGKHRKLAKGRLWIQQSGRCSFDSERRWEGSWWNISLRKFMSRYIIRKRIELPYWDTFQYQVHIKLHRTIVDFLKMESRGQDPHYMQGVH